MAAILRTACAAGLLLVVSAASAETASSLATALDYPASVAAYETSSDLELVTLAADYCDEPACGASDCCEGGSGCADACCDACSKDTCCEDACCGGDACCGDACCGDAIASAMCCPLWTVQVGAVVLDRARPDSAAIVVPLAGPGVISTGNEFSPGWAAGPDVALMRRTERGNTWELRYMGSLAWDTTAVYGGVGNVRIGSFSNFGATALTSRFDSTLDSTEINWRHPLSQRASLLAGFRWIELGEDLTYTITFPAFSANYNWHETNHLYGGQLGGVFDLGNLGSRLSLQSVMKGGVYGNDANNDFTLLPSTGGIFNGGAPGSDVAFVGEIGITGAYHLTEHVALRGGYELLWIDGVALSADNAARATANSSQAGIDSSGDVFYHGAMMSADFTW